MFLRNQFKGVGMFHLPLIKNQNVSLDSVSFIGYDKINQYLHSTPHDHEIDWSNGYPNPGPPINYLDGHAPDFKMINRERIHMGKSEVIIEDYGKFENVKEFEYSLVHGREICIEWKNVGYTILKEGNNNDRYTICEAYKPETEKAFSSVTALLNTTLKTGEYLKDIITEADVIWRNL